MDEEWGRGELRSFIELSKIIQPPRQSEMIASSRQHAGPDELIVAQAAIIESILERVSPTWRDTLPAPSPRFPWKRHWEAATRALSQLERSQELREKLGEDAPRLDASKLHPWAWDGARSLWRSGHYRESVHAAAVKINAETQNKLNRRDISETKLFQAALSTDPPQAGAPRLRLAGDDDGKTAKSVRRGVSALAEGAYAALRNPIGHDEGELDEQRALEQLAVLSVLARYIDDATVLR